MAVNGDCRCVVTTSDYRPVSCDLHSELELLAMRHGKVEVDGERDGCPVSGLACVVLNVLTRDGAEYLELQTPAGARFACRLDRLRRIRLDDGRQIIDQPPE